MAKIDRIPILLLTGFLGSGKTTLLRSLLTGVEGAETAVIVNEFGEIGLDHNLLLGASENTFVLENGCVCCDIRDDLEGSLEELFWQRLRREIPRFTRLVIETTGLADPYRVVEIVSEKSLAAERYQWASIAATVDGVTGATTLDHHIESVSQASIADHLIITKTDIAVEADLVRLEQRLRILNPRAGIHRATNGEFGAPLDDLMVPAGDSIEARKPSTPADDGVAVHLSDVASCWLRFALPVPRAEFLAVHAALIDQFGVSVLRLKGLVELNDRAGLAVVQYVSGGSLEIEDSAFAADETRTSGLVVIASGISESALAGWFGESALAPFLQSELPADAHDHSGHAHHHP